MSKSILVVDTPKSCSECKMKLSIYNGVHYKVCGAMDKNITQYTQSKKGYNRHPQCPLQDTTELLEKVNYALKDNREYLYEDLLNDLYKALGGKENE